MCFRGRDHPAGEHDLERPALANQLGQPLGAAVTGYEPEIDLGLPETHSRRTQPEMTGHSQLTATAQRKAIDGGSDRLGTGSDTEEDILAPGGKPLPFF